MLTPRWVRLKRVVISFRICERQDQRITIKPKKLAKVPKDGVVGNSFFKNNTNFNIQKWIVFLYISNKQPEKKILKIISVKIASKKIK